MDIFPDPHAVMADSSWCWAINIKLIRMKLGNYSNWTIKFLWFICLNLVLFPYLYRLIRNSHNGQVSPVPYYYCIGLIPLPSSPTILTRKNIDFPHGSKKKFIFSNWSKTSGPMREATLLASPLWPRFRFSSPIMEHTARFFVAKMEALPIQ